MRLAALCGTVKRVREVGGVAVGRGGRVSVLELRRGAAGDAEALVRPLRVPVAAGLRVRMEPVAEAGEVGPRSASEKLLVNLPHEEVSIVLRSLAGLANIGVARVPGDVANLSTNGSGWAVCWVPLGWEPPEDEKRTGEQLKSSDLLDDTIQRNVFRSAFSQRQCETHAINKDEMLQCLVVISPEPVSHCESCGAPLEH